MKLFIRITGKKLLVVFLSLFCLLLILTDFLDSAAQNANLISTNGDRVSYIKKLGYSALETPVENKEIIIPQNFSQVYIKYNNLQKSAGYDLMAYKGCTASLYKYELENQDDIIYINLIIYQGHIIGGDISYAKLNGEILPLLPNNKKQG